MKRVLNYMMDSFDNQKFKHKKIYLKNYHTSIIKIPQILHFSRARVTSQKILLIYIS